MDGKSIDVEFIEEISQDIIKIVKDLTKNYSIEYKDLVEPDTLTNLNKICLETLSQFHTLDETIPSLVNKICKNHLHSLHKLDELVYTSLVDRDEHTFIYSEDELMSIIKKINYVKIQPQFEQRTPEWFAHRLEMVTASDLAQTIGKCKYNKTNIDLILRKCGVDKPYISSRATRHGTKYEDVAVMLYEVRNNAVIEDYGCIRHPSISFIGASPDGICGAKSVNKSMVGRMLEIKCPYSRIITGITPINYMIQVQAQLEVCNLEYCDFLECNIKEYDTLDEYLEDIEREDKGIVINAYDTKTKRSVFYYSKKNISRSEFMLWNDAILDSICDSDNLQYISLSYWKLIKYSCVLIKRNRKWFSEILPNVKAFWDKVVYHRANGWEDLLKKKRKYKRKPRNIPKFAFYEDDDDENIGRIEIPTNPKELAEQVKETNTVLTQVVSSVVKEVLENRRELLKQKTQCKKKQKTQCKPKQKLKKTVKKKEEGPPKEIFITI